jgi:hypothetical protein
VSGSSKVLLGGQKVKGLYWGDSESESADLLQKEGTWESVVC